MSAVNRGLKSIPARDDCEYPLREGLLSIRGCVAENVTVAFDLVDRASNLEGADTLTRDGCRCVDSTGGQ